MVSRAGADALEQKLRGRLTGLGLQVGQRLPGRRELAGALGVGRAALAARRCDRRSTR